MSVMGYFDGKLREVSGVGLQGECRAQPNILLVTFQRGGARDMLPTQDPGHLCFTPNDIKTSAMISFQAASRSGAHGCGV
jgi:hypothetical protein